MGVEGIRVLAFDESENLVDLSQTDTFGEFNLTPLQPGIYFLQFLSFQNSPILIPSFGMNDLGKSEAMNIRAGETRHLFASFREDEILSDQQVSESGNPRIFPNPFSDKIFVELKHLQDLLFVQVIDVFGMIRSQMNIQDMTTQNGICTIELGNLHPGYYQLRFVKNDSSRSFGIIKS